MKKVSIFVLLWVAFLVLSMCQGPGIEEAKVTETELNPVEAPRLTQAVITFLSGDVSVLRNETWKYVDIGDFIEQEDTLKVGEDSFCELQFGDKASVRIQENTEVALDTILLEPGQANVTVKLAVGSILSKVGKLSGDERFSVKTSTATCGVRGTEFMVREDPDKTTTVAVKEGVVAVLPASVDVEALKEKAGQENKALIERIEKLEEQAPVFEANEEIVIGEKVLEETEEAFQVVEELVEEIVREETAAPAGGAVVDKPEEEKASEISAEKLEELDRKIEVVIQKSAEQIGPPKKVSEESQEQLDQIEQIRTISIPVSSVGFVGAKTAEAPKEAEAAPAAEAAAEEKPKPVELVKIAIRVDPDDAEVYLNDSFVGKGGFSGIFNEGEELALLIQRDGYGEKKLNVKAEIGSDKEYLVELREIKAAAKTEVAAEDTAVKDTTAEDTTGETAAAKEETVQADATTPAVLSEDSKEEVAEAKPRAVEDTVVEDTTTEDTTVEAAAEAVSSADTTVAEAAAEVTTEPRPAIREQEAVKVIERETIYLSVDPSDAEILLNGTFVDRGSYSGEFEHGERLAFAMRRDEYFEKRLNIFIRDGMQTTFTVALEARPIAGSYSVSESRVVGRLALQGDIVFSADERGKLTALDGKGRMLWSLSTQNDSNASGFPVLIGGRIYFTGPKEFVIVNARSGSVLHRESLDENSSHLFGRRIIQIEDRGLYPRNDMLRIFDLSSGAIQEEISVPEGSRMTPAVYLGNVLLVNQKGEFLIIDPVRRGVFLTIPTTAVQPVAGAVDVYKDAKHGDLAFFGGRRGTVVCVSLSRKKVLWERKLIEGETATIFHDLESGKDGVFVYSEGRLFGLSLENGQDLFKPIEGLSAPPLYEGGRLYYGTEGRQFVMANPVSGRTMKSLYVNGKITTRPVLQDDKVYVGTDGGQIVVINLQGLR